MTNQNVFDTLAASGRNWPDRVAVYDDAGALTYQDLYDEVEVLRGDLTRLGIKPGHGVGVMAANGRHFVVAVLATLACGATVMPLAVQLKYAELESALRVVPLHAILSKGKQCCHAAAERVDQLDGEMVLCWLSQAPRPLIPQLPSTAFIRFTSGTTSQAKGVAITHQSVLERTAAAQAGLELTPGDNIIWVLPMAYHFIVSIILYLRYGVGIIVCPRIYAADIIEFANRFEGSVLYAAPMHYQLLANAPDDRVMSKLRLAISTSAALPKDINETFSSRFGVPVAQAYGIIEIGLPILNTRAINVPQAVGHTLPDYEAVVFDRDLHPLASGQVGQLAIRGPGMFDAYLPYLSCKDVLVANDWFLTGDFASIDNTGLIVVEGRAISVINVAGNKVFPEDVEAVLNAHESVRLSRVFAVPHPTFGEIVHAEIQSEPGAVCDVNELMTSCRAQLSSFKVPQRLVLVDRIPQTSSGKVVRHVGGND